MLIAIIIIIILVILICFTITLYILQIKEINNLTTQLKEIKATNSNLKLSVAAAGKSVKKLALEINDTLKEKQKSEIEYKNMNQEVKQTISNLSHDFRTPLTSIMGYMQLIEDETLPWKEKKEYIDIVKRRAEALQTLIESFYDLSRLEAKEYKFDLKPLKLDLIIYDLIATYYKELTRKGIEPKLHINEKTNMVIADENAVIRIFSNLIQNAIKYGEKDLEIRLEEEKSCIITTISNYSTKLNSEDIKHIFERTFTADRTRTGQGTGIGLAITKELVVQMGHEISAILDNNKLSIIIKWKTLECKV